MKGASKRILFFCAHHSPRALMAASLLTTLTRHPWDIWSTPITTNTQDIDLVRQVLNEIQVPLLPSPQTTEPLFDLAWDEGIVLCSGATDQ